MEIRDIVKKLTGRRPTEFTNKELEDRSGIYLPSRDDAGNPVKPWIGINRELRRDQKELAVAHETGHMADDLGAGPGGMSIRGLERELEDVYSTVNTGKEGLQPPKRPQDFGYPDSDARSEIVADAIRAYLTNPNYFKTVAPNAAAASGRWSIPILSSPNGSSSTAWAGLPYLAGQRARQTMSLIGRD
jgi:hypothetical protein